MPRFLPLLALAVLFVASGCDLFGGDDDSDVVAVSSVLVANSGNFSDQAGSLTVYDPATDEASTLDLEVAFVNGLAVRDGRAYVIDNTASDGGGRITIFDVETFEPLGQIAFDAPPRAIAFASDAKAYVPLFGPFDADFNPLPGAVAVVDLTNNTVVQTLPVGLVPEDVALVGGKLFVANAGSGGRSTTLTVIDTNTDTVAGTLDVGCDGPDELFEDEGGELVVVCTGRAAFTGSPTRGAVVFVDPATETLVGQVPLPNGVGSANGTQAAAYADGELFVLSGETPVVYRVDTAINARTAILLLPQADDLAGASAVAYDARRARLYVARLAVGDAPGTPDFTAAGAVQVLDLDGALVGRFPAGIAPAHIALR